MPIVVVIAAVLGGVAFVESGIAAGESEGSFGKVVIGISLFAAAGVLVFSLVQDPVRTAVFRDGTQVPGGTAGLMSRMVSVRHPRTIGFAGSMGGSASVQVAARGPAVKLRPAQDVMGVPPEIRDALERVVHRYDDTEDLGVVGLNPEGNVRLVDKKPGFEGPALGADEGSLALEPLPATEAASVSLVVESGAARASDGLGDGQSAATSEPLQSESAQSESAQSEPGQLVSRRARRTRDLVEDDQVAAPDVQTATDALTEPAQQPPPGGRRSAANDGSADRSVVDHDEEQSSDPPGVPGSPELLGIEVTPFHEPIDLSHRPLEPYPVPPSDTMNLARQLAELAELRRDGALTEDEFIRAKQLVLGVDLEAAETPGVIGTAGVVHDIRFRFDDGIGRTGS
jgi:hypothetical protein